MTFEEFFIDSFELIFSTIDKQLIMIKTILFVEKIVILFSIQIFGLPN